MRLVSPGFRSQELKRRHDEQIAMERFLKFKQQAGDFFKTNLSNTSKGGKRVLILGAYRLKEIELCLIKGLEMAGYEPVILIMEESHLLRQYYKLTDIREIILWTELFNPRYISIQRQACC